MSLIPPITSLNSSHETQIHSSKDVLTRVKELASNRLSQSLARDCGLNIQEINTCSGSNISDMTLQVQDQAGTNHCLPVIRRENFNRTSDAFLKSFMVIVGNEIEPCQTTAISLQEYLENIHQYINRGEISGSLLTERDEKGVIHNVQTCFLPVEKEEVEFNVALFNYQSCAKNPRELVIVASSQGTSAQIIDNKDDKEGQKLCFNKAGKQCNYLAEREATRKKLLIVQIPLQFKTPTSYPLYVETDSSDCVQTDGIAFGISKGFSGLGLDDAQIRIGEEQGEFVGSGGLTIERDPQFPIRVTTQFYKITNDGNITRQDMELIASQMQEEEDRVAIPGSKGSLALEEANRPTESIKL